MIWTVARGQTARGNWHIAAVENGNLQRGGTHERRTLCSCSVSGPVLSNFPADERVCPMCIEVARRKLSALPALREIESLVASLESA